MTANSLFKLQESIALQISKSKVNYKKSSKERITLSFVGTRLETLENHWKEFQNNHKKIIVEVQSDELEKSSYTVKDLYDTTEEAYIDYKSLLKDAILKLRPDPVASRSAVSQGSEHFSVKLPKIEIPKFSGTYSEWASFRDLFTSLIHKNGTIDNVQKLHYLKSSVTGEAEQLLRHIPVTSDNYQVCWTQLESRYNNKKYLSNCILKKLTTQKALTSESSSGIKQLLDTTKECLSALKNLGVDVNSWDLMIIFLISQKLDAESRKLWEQKITEATIELPTLTMFEEFLRNRFRALEFLDPKVQKQEKSNSCTHLVTANVSCSFCSEGHKIANCKKFAKELTDARRNFAQSHRLCFNCLNTDHTVFQCNTNSRCRLCKKKHHTLLHPKNQVSANDFVRADQPGKKSVVTALTASATSSQAQNESSDVPEITTCHFNTPSQVLLATALVKAESNKNTTVVLRSLLDQGSQASFITESAVQILGLKKRPETGVVTGLGGDRGLTIASKSTVLLKLQSRLDPSFTITVKAHVLNKLTCLLPSSTLSDVQSLPVLSSMELADPSFGTPNRIDLLLGAEVYSQILLDGLVRGPPGSVIAQNTRLGWILSGTVHTATNVNHSEMCHNIVNVHIVHADQQFENELLKKFWELESEPSSHNGIPERKYLTLEEQKCEELYSRTTKRDESGRYIVRLPFKTNNPLCKYGGSRNIARMRFLMLEKRLSKAPELKAEYSRVIKEYVSLGHMEEVSNPDNPDAMYLPHHAVVRQDKITSKVRVVFDASCSGSNGVSLNDDLMTGPTLQPELRHLVMRWRCYPISLVADIVKMYRQIKVADEHIDFQRIFWRDNPISELRHLRLLRLTFGTTSAPYLAVRSLQQLAKDEGNDLPLAQTRVLTDFYMDDLMTGCYSVSEGVYIYQQITTLLNRGGFPLQKWSSNNRELMKQIHDGKPSPENLELKTDEVMKILGLTWNRKADSFQCTVQLPPIDGLVTKRRVISDIARLFDPLGWLAPAITTAKVFIQRLWLSGINWDDALPTQLLKDWIEFRSDLKSLQEIRIPRWISSNIDDKCLELHGFADASNVAFAGVVYARIIDRNGKVHVSLLTSKTRVAPVKQVSIPRLELCGAVLVAKLLKEVAETLNVPKQHWHAWTDSSIVLAWLSNHPSRWKTFIANRVSEILTIMDRSQWSHVASKDNAADPASRGLKPSECVGNVLWNRGPEWLHLEQIHYTKGNLKDTNLEEKQMKMKCHALTCDDDDGDPFLERFSSLRRLVRVLAWCRRLYLHSGQTKGPWLTAVELQDVMQACIKRCQGRYLTEEIRDKKGKFSSLNPFKDDNGIWRVGGRLLKADLSEGRKHPILIPRQSHLAKLIIGDAHERTLHGGPLLTINYIQSKYWIVHLRNLVKSYIHRCVTCVRYSSQAVHPMMGHLPSARVTASRPFRQSGLDYAGPVSVRTTKGRGHRSTKGYICLFVCMATRAIHLEVVSDLTSETFLAAFKRFVSRRGHCADLWSDNATTFVGADRELKALLTAERSSVVIEIADWLSVNGTTWHRIPPYSPNFGGLWEAGIKSTKNHLKRVIGDSTLTFEELTTVLAQIEACLNSRPISRISDGSDDPAPLTPGHFLVGEPLVLVPDHNYEGSHITSLRRWQLTQRMVQDFWRRWSREYLTQFLHRYKWKQSTPEPQIGDVVLVKEDDLPPARWLYGIVVEKHCGSDNVTRVVSLRCKGATIKRPVSKLCKLPVTD